MLSMIEPREPISDTEIIALYRAGHSQNDITRRYDVTVLHTRRVLRSAGFNTNAFRALTHTMIRVINQLVVDGVIYRDIETICDLSFHAVRDHVLRTKVKTSTPAAFRVGAESSHHNTVFDLRFRDRFLDGYRSGKSFCALVDELNLSDESIFDAFCSIKNEDIAKHRANLARCIEIEHAKGFSDAAVAKKLDISRSIVRARLRN